jgi:putative phosphoribosyl transferase
MTTSLGFQDRAQAGQILARHLMSYAGRPDVLVLALPRGGVPVAAEVARVLKAPLDVIVVRKLGVPGREELAMGAIASGDVRVLNDEIIDALQIPPHVVDAVTLRELRELKRREQAYRGERAPLCVRGCTVILVDDGVATGSTMKAALATLKRLDPARLVVAVPVAPPSTCAELRDRADECICVNTPEPFFAVATWYQDFSQTTDHEVRELLDLAAVDTKAAS